MGSSLGSCGNGWREVDDEAAMKAHVIGDETTMKKSHFPPIFPNPYGTRIP